MYQKTEPSKPIQITDNDAKILYDTLIALSPEEKKTSLLTQHPLDSTKARLKRARIEDEDSVKPIHNSHWVINHSLDSVSTDNQKKLQSNKIKAQQYRNNKKREEQELRNTISRLKIENKQLRAQCSKHSSTSSLESLHDLSSKLLIIGPGNRSEGFFNCPSYSSDNDNGDWDDWPDLFPKN